MITNSPSLSASPLTSGRREQAAARSADATHSLLEWAPVSRPPAQSGFVAARSTINHQAATKRVLFTGGFWMTDEPVAAWRPVSKTSDLEKPFRPVSALQGELIERKVVKPGASPAARTFDELALVAIDSDLKANGEVGALQQLSSMELRVEVVRFMKPAPDATGVSTGRVLAVSENFSAQDIGNNKVLIHENASLDRTLAPGEKVTMGYNGGKATVYDGLAHEINIHAPWMPREQHNYMRMVMLDALSMMKDPMSDDDRLKGAMKYALESTASFFGVDQSRVRMAEIKLEVNDVKAPVYAPATPSQSLAAVPEPRRPQPRP